MTSVNGDGDRLPVASWPRVSAFHQRNAHIEVFVPHPAPGDLRHAVFAVRTPCGDVVEGGPVRHGDAETIRTARSLDTEETLLPGGEFDHAPGHGAITFVDLRPPRREDHRVIRWC